MTDAALLGGAIVHELTSPARWSTDDWLRIPAAGVGLLGLTVLDRDGRAFMRAHQGEEIGEAATGIEALGTVSNFAILGAFYAAGAIGGDRRARSIAMEGLASSLIAAGLITPALQRLAGRSRPWTGRDPYTLSPLSGNISFPSGHTTQAFAVAAVIASEYDAWWVKLSAYGLASLVGVSRMYHGAHYLSDVTAAALIGTVVGRSVVRYGRRERGAAAVSPELSPLGPGIGVSIRF